MTKRIALISTNADLAGAPLHVQTLATGLSKSGYTVSVIFGEDGHVRQSLMASGMKTFVVPTIRSNFNAIEAVKSFISVRRILSQIDPDIVHTHSAKASLIGRLAARSLSIPCVYTVHSWGFGFGRKRISSAIIWLIELCMRLFTSHYIFVAYSESLIATEILGINKRNFTVIPNGIPDTDLRAKPSLSTVVTMVARDEFPKDYSTFFSACRGLKCEIWCIGKHTDTEVFFQKYRLAEIEFNSEPLRYGTRSDVDKLLSLSGIFVLSTWFEGLPLSILEAMRAGLPVIASDVGGISELVNPSFGFVVPAGDSKAFADSIKRLLDDSVLRAKLGDAGRIEYERNYTFEKMLTRTIQVYSEI